MPPTKEPQLRWVHDRDHLHTVSLIVQELLHGGHNEVHDLAVDNIHDFTHFPSSGQIETIFSATNSGPGLAVGDVRFNTVGAHGLVAGEIAVISSSSYNESYVITNVQTTTSFDVTVTWTGSSTGWLNQGFTNDRITPDTIPILIPLDSIAAGLQYTANYMLHTGNVGYIQFSHTSSPGACDFKLLLFGD